MANMYRSVLSGGGGVQPTGDAQVGDVLAGKTFSNADGIDKTGTMVNNGAVSATVAGGQSYTIPAGFHNGSGIVTGLGGTVDTSFTPESPTTTGVAGTNFTVGKYYIIMTMDSVSSITGGTEIQNLILGSVARTPAARLVKATATTITCNGAGYTQTMAAEITLD